MRLTETILRTLPTPAKDTLAADEATTGLYLRQYATGRKTWLYRTRKGGAWRTENLGEWPAVGLAQARARATALGTTTLPAAKTFGELLTEWFERRIEPRYKTTKNIETYVARGRDWFGTTKLTQLSTPLLVAKLQEYGNTFPIAANRCLSNWKLCLDYAVECGYLSANPLARTSARVIGGEEQSRTRTLTDAEIVALWRNTHHHAALLRFLLLTGLRISEAQRGHRDGNRWEVPAEHSKNGKPHWAHLPPLAIEQLAAPFDTSPTAVQAWLRNTLKASYTPHDLRRTFATRLAGLGVAPHVVEKCLNHTMQGVMATYNRHDYESERIAAAEQWAAAVREIVA